MRGNSSRMRYAIDMNTIGLCLFCIYIFISYLANDVVLPSVINTYALYAFLGYSILYIFVKKKLKINSIVKWLALFMIFSLISMLYSPEKSIFSGTFYLMIVNFILVLLISQYELTGNTIESIGWVYSFSALILVVLLIATGNIFDTSDSGRLGEDLLGNANILATMLMIAALYTIWLLVFTNCNKSRKILLILCVVTEYLGMFLSGGRKYIVVPIVFLYILLLFKQDKNGRKHIIKYTVVILVLLIIIWNLIIKVPVLYEIIGSRMESFLSFLSGDISHADGSSKIRSQMIRMGLEALPEHPILGHGFDSFKYFNRSVTGHFYYSHNNFVEILYNTGIIGFVIYYWFYFKLGYTVWKERRILHVKTRAFVVAVVLAMLCYEYGAINYTATSTMLMMCFSCILLNSESRINIINGTIRYR